MRKSDAKAGAGWAGGWAQRLPAVWAAFALAAGGLGAYPVPKGTPILRNGTFLDAKDRPVHWVTRSTGDLGSFDLLPPEADDGSAILSIKVTRAHQQPWMLELRQKLSGELQKGQTLFVGFEYRMSEDYAFHVYWQKDSSPWPKYLAVRIGDAAAQWERCMVTVPIPETLAGDQTSLSFHLAEATGTVQFRNIAVVVVDEGVDPLTVETTIQPVFGGDYYDQDWRSTVLDRIEKQRKSDMAVVVTRANQPVPGAVVKVAQTSRPFSFGVEMPAALMVDALQAEDTTLTALQRRMGSDVEHLPAFRAKVMEPGLFDVIAIEDAFIWREHLAWGKDVAPGAIAWIQSGGKAVRGHGVFVPAFRHAPPRCRLMEREELLNAALSHFRALTGRYRGQVNQWVVLHGPLSQSEIYDVIGVESLIKAMEITQRQDPDAALFVSDPDALLLPSENRVGEVIEFLGWLRSEGVKVDGLLLGASLSRPYMAPQTMEQRLDRIASSGVEVPIYIVSLELETDKENTQASMLKDLISLFYSHRAVRGVSLSNIWEPAAVNRRCALYRPDMKQRRSGKMLETLLTQEWLTQVQGPTDAAGLFQTRAFHGQYTVTVAFEGKEVTIDAQVDPQPLRLQVRLD